MLHYYNNIILFPFLYFYLRNDEAKINKSYSRVKSKCDDDKSNKLATENFKRSESESNYKKHTKENDKIYKNDKKEVENKYKSDRENCHKKDSKSDHSRNSKKDKLSEEFHKSNSKDVYESKRQDNSPRHRTPVKERDRNREKEHDKYSNRHQKNCDDSKSNKYDKKSNRANSKYNPKKRNETTFKELKRPLIQREKLTCISDGDSDSVKSCYTPPPKDMNAFAKFGKSKINDEKNVKSTKYTFSLRDNSEDRLVLNKINGRTDLLKLASQNNSDNQHKKPDSQNTNDRIDKIFLDSSSSEEGDLGKDIDLNIIKEITTEKIKKVFELHEKQEQALLHLKKKLMEKKRKIRTSSSSSESSIEEPIKKKSVKRIRIRDSSSSNRFDIY